MKTNVEFIITTVCLFLFFLINSLNSWTNFFVNFSIFWSNLYMAIYGHFSRPYCHFFKLILRVLAINKTYKHSICSWWLSCSICYFPNYFWIVMFFHVQIGIFVWDVNLYISLKLDSDSIGWFCMIVSWFIFTYWWSTPEQKFCWTWWWRCLLPNVWFY